MKNGKVWGMTELVFQNESFEVHRIEIKKGGFCSTHCHEFKHNMFYVESGKLEIYITKNAYKLVDETTLYPREKTTAKPGEYHFFRAPIDTVAYEIYYSQPIGMDIIRKSCGGME